jgi:site-specific DNA-cytosine methylase
MTWQVGALSSILVWNTSVSSGHVPSCWKAYPGFAIFFPNEFRDILTILKTIGYAVNWKILDSRFCGLPQRRPRVYIVGIRSDSISSTFSFPQDMKVQPKIDKFLNMLPAKRFLPQTQTQRRNLEVAMKTISSKGLQGTILVDLAASARFENQGVDIAPCITATRAKTGGFFIMNQKRMTTTDELGRLQGFPTWAVDKMLSTSANAGDIRFAIGNAMSVNVLVRLLPRVLHSAGLLKDKPRDIWKHMSSKNAKAFKKLPDDMYGATDGK